MYSPGDGHIDPYSLTQALAIGARKHGAQIQQGCGVTATRQTDDHRWQVDTDQGTITADRVVNAAG